MKPVILHTLATEEVREAVDFYNDRRPGLGDEFGDAVADALVVIGKRPKACPPYKRGFRKFVMKRFPFLIFYEEFDDHVWVATVYHASREPDLWLERGPETN